MGPKKINSSKEYTGQNSENPKKKNVAAPHNRALPQNLKENTRTLKKSATTCSLSVPSHIINTRKSHIPHSHSVRQIKKQIHSNYTDNIPSESNTRSTVSFLKSQISTPKKFIGPGKTVSPIRNAKEKVVDAGKMVSKNKPIKKKEDSRLSKPTIHTVAFYEDVSMQFKERSDIRDQKREYQMAKIMGGLSEGTNSFLTGIFNDQSDIISNPLNNYTMLNEIKITNCNTQGQTKAEIISRDIKVAENDINCVTDAKLIVDETYKPLQNIVTPNAYYNKLENSKKSNKTMNNLNSPDKFCMLEENNVPGTTNDFIGTLLVESNFNSLSYWNPGCYPQTENSMTNDGKGIQSGTENMVQNLSKELISPVKNENPNLTYETELKHSNTPLNNSKELSKEIKKSVSASTMKSFDRETFTLEKPFNILGYAKESRVVDDISNYKSFGEEKDITFPNIHESSSPNDINANRIVKNKTDQDVKLSERGSIEITNPMIREKEVVEENSYNAAPNFIEKINNTYEMTELLLRQLLEEDDNFDPAETLDILNFDSISKNESEKCFTQDILQHFQPNQQSTVNSIHDYEKDEFATESEEVEDSLDINNYVWMDYKMPLNTSKLDDGSEIWILDNESGSEDESQDPIVFLEPDDQEWVITEKKFEEVKKCLDECRADAESVSKEVSRLKSRNPNSFSDREKHASKSLRDKSNTNFPINNENLGQTSNRNKPDQKLPDSALNTSVVEEDLDFFSVSSSEELSDVEKNKTTKDVKPQKSFLSFGKSCVKINKKGEKNVLSFFNFFK